MLRNTFPYVAEASVRLLASTTTRVGIVVLLSAMALDPVAASSSTTCSRF